MSDSELRTPTLRALLARAAIGLAQGIGLYLLWKFAEQFDPPARGALALVLLFVPIVALGSLWAARRRTAIIWVSAATLLAAGIGAYANYANPPGVLPWRGAYWVSWTAGFFTAAALFILHHLIIPADAERRWRASYERYFDEGWKDAVRLALAALFVGVFWLVLYLGAALFEQIGLKFLRKLITNAWFYYPATTTFLALAVHLTDVRVGLVRGARTLLLTLLSWLLPVLALIALGFLAALPFTGLRALFSGQTTSGVLLGACAALVILINATYQDGERDGFPPMALKWAARFAAVALPPLVLLAIYGVLVRIGQHGLSVSRIQALACLIVAACYAGGYAWAALSRGPWMRRLERTNVLTAYVAVTVVVLIFSPVFDPARIAVADQVARLNRGSVKAADFDFAFLRFEAGRWGREALEQLAAGTVGPRDPEVARLAANQRTRKSPWDAAKVTPVERRARIQFVGDVPASFIDQDWGKDDPTQRCGRGRVSNRNAPAPCSAITMELDGEPGLEVVLLDSVTGHEVFGLRNGRWEKVGRLEGSWCPGDELALRAGRFKAGPPASSMEVNGHSFPFVRERDCAAAAARRVAAETSDEVVDVELAKPSR